MTPSVGAISYLSKPHDLRWGEGKKKRLKRPRPTKYLPVGPEVEDGEGKKYFFFNDREMLCLSFDGLNEKEFRSIARLVEGTFAAMKKGRRKTTSLGCGRGEEIRFACMAHPEESRKILGTAVCVLSAELAEKSLPW